MNRKIERRTLKWMRHFLIWIVRVYFPRVLAMA